MKNNELAKKLLSGEIQSEFVWIYEITNGIIKKENKGLEIILRNEASTKYFDMRIVRPGEMLTMDWQSKRINIHLDDEDNIINIYLG